MALKNDRSTSKKIAAWMRARGIERTTGRCALCYAIIEVDSSQSRYRHRCRLS